MVIDTGVAAIFVTILLSLLAMAVAWGTLRERVRQNDEGLTKLCNANSDQHQRIFDKLDEVRKEIQNGRSRKE